MNSEHRHSPSISYDNLLRRMVLDDYERWESTTRTHNAGVFLTSTLRAIEALLPEHVENSAETGCGKSTILFSNIAEHHTVFAFDDRNLGNSSSVLFYEECPLTKLERINFVPGPTQQTLPSYTQHRPLDLLLIDGPHGYPFPELEYYYFYPHMRPGALLILDDVLIPTIARLADFLAEDEMFETVAIVDGTAIFRRTSKPIFDPFGDGWFEQIYNRRRVSPNRAIFIEDGDVIDQFTSQHIDHKILGKGNSPAQLSFWSNPNDQSELIRINMEDNNKLKQVLIDKDIQLDHLNDLLAKLDIANKKLDEVFASTSWRITGPLRKIIGMLKKIF